jgi:MtN3 and saliva related transmembrane protein
MRQFVAWIFGLGLIGNALLFVPQAIALFRKKSDEGVSLLTFGGFSVLQVIGVVHGFYEHDNSLIIGLGASFLTCGTVTALTIFYRSTPETSPQSMPKSNSPSSPPASPARPAWPVRCAAPEPARQCRQSASRSSPGSQTRTVQTWQW